MKRRPSSNMKEIWKSTILTISYLVSSLKGKARKLWYISMLTVKISRWLSLWWTSWSKNFELISFVWSILATVYIKIKHISIKLRPNREQSRSFRMLRQFTISWKTSSIWEMTRSLLAVGQLDLAQLVISRVLSIQRVYSLLVQLNLSKTSREWNMVG